jgi:hypothetical protein
LVLQKNMVKMIGCVRVLVQPILVADRLANVCKSPKPNP